MARMAHIFSAFVCVALFSTAAAAEEVPSARLCVQPLEPYPVKMLESVVRGIEYIYGFEVVVLEARKIPKSTWYAPRKRYRADKLLDWMRSDLLPQREDCRWIVGLTRSDVSVTKGEHKDWGVLGLGEVDGRVAVVSSFRTHKKLREPHTALRRTVKVVNHEIGHMMGLPHVKGEGCLMNDAEGTVLTTDLETGLLCQSTIEFIERHKRLRIPRHSSMQWDAIE
jgi:archaemetzincin